MASYVRVGMNRLSFQFRLDIMLSYFLHNDFHRGLKFEHYERGGSLKERGYLPRVFGVFNQILSISKLKLRFFILSHFITKFHASDTS